MYACGKDDRAKQPLFECDIDGVIYKLWQCPINHIPKNVIEFINEYDYTLKYPSVKMPKYSKLSRKWYEAVRLYENYKSEYEREKAKL